MLFQVVSVYCRDLTLHSRSAASRVVLSVPCAFPGVVGEPNGVTAAYAWGADLLPKSALGGLAKAGAATRVPTVRAAISVFMFTSPKWLSSGGWPSRRPPRPPKKIAKPASIFLYCLVGYG